MHCTSLSPADNCICIDLTPCVQVLGTPEVARVYIGSFWDQPLRYDINRRLFEAEEQVTRD